MLYQGIALAVLAVFYGCYFLKMIAQKRSGITTDQIGKGKTGFVKAIEITMKIVTCLVPAVEIVSILLNTTALPASVRTLGAAIGLTGAAVFILSVLTMRDNWRAGVSPTDKTDLVTEGIYRYSRNPAFLGFDLVYLGILLMFFNPVLLAVSVFAGAMLHLQIVNVVEDFLLTAFGDRYSAYKRQVCRYIGRRRTKE